MLASNDLSAITWAERNPQKEVLVGRSWAKPTEAQKASQKIAARRNKAARELLSSDVITLITTHKQQLEELATKHSVTIQHIKKLVDNTSHYKKTCAPNLANAITHLKVKELNEGRQLLPTPHSKLILAVRFATRLKTFAQGS